MITDNQAKPFKSRSWTSSYARQEDGWCGAIGWSAAPYALLLSTLPAPDLFLRTPSLRAMQPDQATGDRHHTAVRKGRSLDSLTTEITSRRSYEAQPHEGLGPYIGLGAPFRP